MNEKGIAFHLLLNDVLDIHLLSHREWRPIGTFRPQKLPATSPRMRKSTDENGLLAVPSGGVIESTRSKSRRRGKAQTDHEEHRKEGTLDLRHLRHFVAVAEELHFTRAAQRANIEQSPLSRSIKNLEKRLGVELLERTKRSTSLTVAGKRLLAHARAILAAADEARVDVRAAADDETDHLHVGICDGVPLPRAARLLASLKQESPHICVHVHEVPMTQKIHELRAGFLDVALAPESGYGKGIISEPVWRDLPIAIIPGNHPLARKEGVDLAEVAREPLVLCRPDTGLSQQSQIEHIVRTVTTTPNIVDRPATLCMMVMLVFAGYGIGIATVAQLEAVCADDFVLRPIHDAPKDVKTWLMMREEAPAGPLARFVELARRIA